MKRNYLLTFLLLIILILVSFASQGYCSLFTRYSIETHDNPYTDYSLYRSFGFYEDDKTKMSSDYLPNKHLQMEIIKLLEEKGYKYKENFIEADLVMFLFSSNEYSSSTSSVPIYQSNNQYSHYSGSIGGNYFHGNINTFGGGSWNSITVTKNRYYPYVGMSFIDNLSKTYEKVWEGSGITSSRKSDIEKYGCEIIERILEEFPEMSYVYHKTEEKVEKKGNEKINNLLNELKNRDSQSDKSTGNATNKSTLDTTLNSELKTDYDFRKTTWGMNQSEVMQSEEGVSKFLKDYDEGGRILFQGDASGIPCYIFYEFSEGKLTQTAYWFYSLDKSHDDKDVYISDYFNLKEKLTKKYGNPSVNKQIWNNDLYKNDSKKWGVAISLGHSYIITRWETSVTEIGLVLSGKDNGVNLYILYTSKELKDLMKKVNENNKSRDDF